MNLDDFLLQSYYVKNESSDDSSAPIQNGQSFKNSMLRNKKYTLSTKIPITDVMQWFENSDYDWNIIRDVVDHSVQVIYTDLGRYNNVKSKNFVITFKKEFDSGMFHSSKVVFSSYFRCKYFKNYCEVQNSSTLCPVLMKLEVLAVNLSEARILFHGEHKRKLPQELLTASCRLKNFASSQALLAGRKPSTFPRDVVRLRQNFGPLSNIKDYRMLNQKQVENIFFTVKSSVRLHRNALTALSERNKNSPENFAFYQAYCENPARPLIAVLKTDYSI